MKTKDKLRRIGLSLTGLALCLAGSAGAAPIGVNWVNNGNGNAQNDSADSMVATDLAGAPGFEQGNWNNLGRWGNSINLVDGNGVATGVMINWDATGAWNNGASTTDANGKLMYGYVDSNGNANTTLGGPRVYDAGNDNKPVVYVSGGLQAWMAAQGATSYDVVIYSDGDSSDGSRIGQFWLQNCTGPYSAWVPGSDLSTHVFIRDSANFGNTGTFTQVPLTSTTGGNAVAGNYAIFTGLTNDTFLLRTEDSPYTRSPINGIQIVPRSTAGDPPALLGPNSVTNYAGSSNVLSAAVGGILPMTYQWMAGPIGSTAYTNVLDGNNIAGATTPTLTITNLQFANQADYVLVAKGPYGTATTLPTTLRVVAGLITGATPASEVLYPGATAHFSTTVSAATPSTFQWRKNGTPLADGGRISGAATNLLVINNVTASDAGSYDLVVTTPYGTVTSQASSLSLLAPPTTGSFAEAVITNQPLAFWRFGESSGPTVYDNGGGFNGTYEANAMLAQTGPQPSDFLGFESSNTGVGLAASDQSWMTVPALNLNTNTVTIVAWVYPNGDQPNWAGILTTRSGGTQAGFNFTDKKNELAYTWNNNTTWQYHSGLIVPSLQWSMVALVVSPTNATFYLGNPTTGLVSAVITLTNASEAWAGTATIGEDQTWGASRAFWGTMDEVAVFNHALSPAAMTSLYAAGRAAGMLPPTIAQSPDGQNLYPGRTAQFTVVASGTPPLKYQWRKNGANLADGGNISGATSATLSVANVQASDASTYDVVVSNPGGSVTSSAATLALTAPSGKAFEAAMIAAAPFAYYRLNETSGPNAFDYYGGHAAAFGSAAMLGIPGPSSSDFAGFESLNTAMGVYNSMPGAWVTTPPFNFTTNTVTLTAWIYPTGIQATNAGLIFQRQGLTVAGLTCGFDGAHLGYSWNNNASAYNWNSGLSLPEAQWSFVALVVEPTKATLYLCNAGGLKSAVNVLAHPVQPFAGLTYIGNDSYDANGGRMFSGTIDEVGIFNRPLSGEEIAALYTGASGVTVAPSINVQPASQTAYAGGSVSFSVNAAGSPTLKYQWRKNGTAITGATASSYTIAGAALTDIGDYTVVVNNTAGTVTSSAAKLNVWDANTAELINVDINNGTSATFAGGAVLGSPSDVWNGISGTAAFGPVVLTDATGLVTPVTLTVAKNDGSGYTMTGGNNLLADYSYGTNQTVTLNNLRPNATYYLVVYSIGGGGNTGFEGGVFSGAITGISYGSPLGALQITQFIEGTNFVRNTKAVSDANGTLTFQILPVSTVAANANGSGDFNGLQLQHVPDAGLRPTIVQQPASLKLYAGQPGRLSVTAGPQGSGLTYQWYKGSTLLAGATTDTLRFASMSAADAGNYSVVVGNPAGTITSETAAVTVLTPTPGSYSAALLSYGPLAYWQLDEATGTSVAYDYVSGRNGTYLSNAVHGVTGVPTPPFPGFGPGNLALQVTAGTTQSWATVPALSLNTNTVTLTAWIYPVGVQSNWTGIFMTRDGTAGGLGYNDQGMLAYTWNNNSTWSYASGLVIPADQWSFVALTIAPTNAALYLFNANGQQVANNPTAHQNEAWNGTGLIGNDTDGVRLFNGLIDEVAVFNRTLSPAEIANLYGAVPFVSQTVKLTLQQVGANLQLSWPQGTLLEANDLTGPWTTNTTTSPYTVPTTTAAKKFYRVIVK